MFERYVMPSLQVIGCVFLEIKNLTIIFKFFGDISSSISFKFSNINQFLIRSVVLRVNNFFLKTHSKNAPYVQPILVKKYTKFINLSMATH